MVFTTWKERSKEDMKIHTKEFKCDINLGILLGKRGENIKFIQKETNTHISIMRGEKIIIITAYCNKNIENAIKIINELREKSKKDNQELQNYNNVDIKTNFNLQTADFPSLTSDVIKTTKKSINSIWGNKI